MSVRHSLLAILDQGSCYGYQLRTEFARRTGSTWPLNVGQIYNTLERLRRDGLVAEAGTDEHGHVYWRITDAGSRAVRAWIAEPAAKPAGARDELAAKVALAATLRGVDVTRMLHTQRIAAVTQLETLRSDAAQPGIEMTRWLVLEARVRAAEAELGWIDAATRRLDEQAPHAVALELSTEKPKRGRPAGVEAVA